MTGSSPTVVLTLFLSIGAPLLARSVAESRREVAAVAGANAALEVQSELLAAKVRDRRDHASEIDAELAERKGSVARLLTLFPSPEIATPERLMELVQEHSKATGLHMWTGCIKPSARKHRERLHRGIREIHLAIEGPMRGTLEQIVDFLRRVERHATFVRVNTFEIHQDPRSEPGDGRLCFVLELSTFRFDSETR